MLLLQLFVLTLQPFLLTSELVNLVQSSLSPCGPPALQWVTQFKFPFLPPFPPLTFPRFRFNARLVPIFQVQIFTPPQLHIWRLSSWSLNAVVAPPLLPCEAYLPPSHEVHPRFFAFLPPLTFPTHPKPLPHQPSTFMLIGLIGPLRYCTLLMLLLSLSGS